MKVEPQYIFQNKKIEDIWHIFFALADSLSFEISIGKKGNYGISTETMMSALNTLTAIDFCRSRNTYSDAYTLIRKYRDDLMQYLFILNVIQNTRGLTEDELNAYSFDLDSIRKMIESDFSILISGKRKSDVQLAMESWMYNDLDDTNNAQYRKQYFDTSKYKKYLMSTDKRIDSLMTTFLNPIWISSDRTLNNYVHTNGKKYLTDNYIYQVYSQKKTFELVDTLQQITNIFLCLLAIVDSTKMRSSDYMDYIEMGEQPPDNCQYWVRPCIIDYFNINLSKELLSYIQANETNGMMFMSKDYKDF